MYTSYCPRSIIHHTDYLTRRLPSIVYHPQSATRRLLPTACHPPSTIHRVPIKVYRPPSTVHRLPSTCLPSTVYHPQSTIHHLPTTLYQPPSTISQLPSTVYHPLLSKVLKTSGIQIKQICHYQNLKSYEHLTDSQTYMYIVFLFLERYACKSMDCFFRINKLNVLGKYVYVKRHSKTLWKEKLNNYDKLKYFRWIYAVVLRNGQKNLQIHI